MKLTRRRFIALSSGTVAALMLGLDGCNSNRLQVCGHVYDQYGFPVKGAQLNFVTGYSLLTDEGFSASDNLTGLVTTDSLGKFELTLDNPHTDVAFRVLYNNQLQRIVAKQITGTTIPFFDTEVWSPDTSKTINDIQAAGTLNNITIYIDTSRTHLWNYFLRHHADLVNLLQNNQADDGETAWEGDHSSPDDANTCDNCDNHYGPPQFERERKINPPWGKDRGVIPFVSAEGIIFSLSVNEPGGDGDRDFDLVLEPQYLHLINNHNESSDQLTHSPEVKANNRDFHVEMCNIFMGKKGANASLTSLNRDADSRTLNALLNGRRVWLTGTWTIEGDHDHWNEIHPTYWIVPFIGGWRRFVASEIVRMGLNSSGAKSIIADQLTNDPDSLIETLSANFKLAAAVKSKTGMQMFYTSSIVHLNKFGINSAFPGTSNAANSINENDFAQEASTLSLDEMTSNITNRYSIFFNQLTTVGCGVFVFPAIIFIREGCDIIQQADALHLNHPVELVISPNELLQVSLGNEVLAFDDLIVDNGAEELKSAFADLFNQMSRSEGVSATQIANYYADVSIRLISYGMYDDSNQQHSKNRADHFNWALPRAKTDIQELINSIAVRIDDLWKDAFPFTRSA